MAKRKAQKRARLVRGGAQALSIATAAYTVSVSAAGVVMVHPHGKEWGLSHRPTHGVTVSPTAQI